MPPARIDPAQRRFPPCRRAGATKVVKDEKLNIDPHAGLTISNGRFTDMGNLRMRYYAPADATKDSMLPVIACYRGGGLVVADLDNFIWRVTRLYGGCEQ